ncbi:hypothetical protein B0T26DRAFT_649688, partial [Lasiosphaeria miniovina]
GGYVTLSHRWVQPITEECSTIGRNLEARLQGRGFENLPRIFTDAILLCFHLKIRYIWIDALCIVQDDDNTHS